MLNIFGSTYYIDLMELDSFLLLDSSQDKDTTTKTVESWNGDNNFAGKDVIVDEVIKVKEVNGVKFEIVRNFISDLSDGADGEFDDTLGSRNLDKLGVRFKLAFNTLTHYNILKKLN